MASDVPIAPSTDNVTVPTVEMPLSVIRFETDLPIGEADQNPEPESPSRRKRGSDLAVEKIDGPPGEIDAIC